MEFPCVISTHIRIFFHFHAIKNVSVVDGHDFVSPQLDHANKALAVFRLKSTQFGQLKRYGKPSHKSANSIWKNGFKSTPNVLNVAEKSNGHTPATHMSESTAN